MSEYTPLSQIINGEDSQFNEIRDESTSITDDEIEAKNSSLPETTPILKPSTKSKRRRETVDISTVLTAEEQSVISAISKTSLHSKSNSFDMTSILVETSSLDRVFSELSGVQSPKPSACASAFESFDREQELRMPACVSENIPSCLNDEALLHTVLSNVQEDNLNGTFSPSLFTTSQEENPPALSKKQATGQSFASRSFSKPSPCTFCFNQTEPVTSISELFASFADQFKSSSLNVDGDCSVVSSVCIKKYMDSRKHIVPVVHVVPVEKATPKEQRASMEISDILSDLTLDSPTVMLKEKRMYYRNLLDSLMPEAPLEFESPKAPKNIAEDSKDEALEEENIMEGLGLNLPTVSPKLETKDSSDANLAPQSVEKEDSHGADLATAPRGIETKDPEDASPAIVDNKVDTSHRDVYLTYRIEGYLNRAESAMSESGDSTTPILTPKQSSGPKSFFMPRWGKKLFSSRNKDKTKTKSKNKNKDTTRKRTRPKKNGITKQTQSITDSPGAATVGTEETARSMVNYATFSFAEDHPVNPRKLSFQLRPRTRA